jgi:ABC-type multidrug transport system ATPase subunit
MTMEVIRTTALTKRYRGVRVVDDLHLEVREGDLFGFIGPNGSGKTTTLRMILGLVYATSGRITVLDRLMPRAAREVLPHIGALIEGPAFYAHLSGAVNLRLLDAAGPGAHTRSRKRRVAEAMDRVGLAAADRRPVKAYSSGMKQRLGLAASFLRRPRLLVLDEPTNGLDPQASRDIRDLLIELVAEGTTILLSSHLLAEVETTCNRAAIIFGGRLVAQNDVARLLAPTGRVVIDTPDVHDAERVVAALPQLHVLGRQSQRISVHLNGLPPELLNRRLVESGIRVRELAIERPSLEQVFLSLTGGLNRDSNAQG